MESIQHINKKNINKVLTKRPSKRYKHILEEIDAKHQQQQSSQKTTGWRSYISFSSDKERKLSYFTGKFDKRE